jgi:hypothetical protein
MSKWEIPAEYEIPKNTRCHIPHRWIFFDVVTTEEKLTDEHSVNRLGFGWALYYERARNKHGEKTEWHKFQSIQDFWDWVIEHERSRETLHLAAHSIPIGLMVLAGFRELPIRDYKLANIYHNQTTSIMSWRKEKAGIRVIDSRNWWDVSIRELASMVHSRTEGMANNETFDSLDSEACKNNVYILYRAVRGLADELAENDLGSLRYTAASVAWSVFRHKFYGTPITTHHKTVPVALERSAYVGGYVSVRKLYAPPDKLIVRLDVNSMYPFIMREDLYPVELTELLPGLDIDRLARILLGNCMIADVDVETDEPIYPFRSGKRVFYPVGKFRSTLCTGSLWYALDKGHLRKIRLAAVYKAGWPFVEYVDHWYAERIKAKKAHDTVRERFAKLCLNSLYGKFGQRATNVTRIGSAPIDVFRSEETWDTVTNEHWRMLEAGGERMRIDEGGETLTSFPAIAAHVTDYARQYIWALANKAGLENAYYIDTDSLFVNTDGVFNLGAFIEETAIGKLKEEAHEHGVKIYAKKDYQFGTDRTCKVAGDIGKLEKDGSYTETQRLGIYAAAEIEAIEGAYLRYVSKMYNPYVDGCTIDRDLSVHPLKLPRDQGELFKRHYTLPKLERKE